MDLTVGRTVGPTVDSTVGWTVGLTVKLCKHWFDSRPTIDPTVEITGQPVSWTQASDASGRLLRAAMRWSMWNACTSNGGRSFCVQISRERSYSLPISWYLLKGNWLRYNFVADSFYIMKLCSRLFVLYCWNCPKDDKFRYVIPTFRKLGAA